MRIALASKPFLNGNTKYNLNTMLLSMQEAKFNQVDMICFGEAFLQGFDALTWDYEQDQHIALSLESDIINQIRLFAKEIGLAVGFGYLEKEGDELYCSYLVVDHEGDILQNFKRVSVGWKVPHADVNHYKEGTTFSHFHYKDRTFTVGLCGDFWFDEHIETVTQLKKDITLWPLYVNFPQSEFETKWLPQYLERASKLQSRVLFINSLSKDPDAFGGCYEFLNNAIVEQLPYGQEGILYTEV